MLLHRFLIILISVFLFACVSNVAKQAKSDKKETKPANAGFLIMFSEMRPHEPEASVRMMITDQFLRIDEGPNSEDFILFDRRSKSIFNVVQEDKSILTIKPVEKDIEPPFPLRWIIESQTSQALMRSQNNNDATATHYLYYLNEEPCYNLVTINNQLVETLDAMREYNQVLGNELKSNYHHMEGQQCHEAINIFDPNIRLQYGFPLREWSVYGYQRFLVDFKKDIIFPASLFELPKNYQNISL